MSKNRLGGLDMAEETRSTEETTNSIEMVLVDREGKEHRYEPVMTLGVRGQDFIVLQPVGEGGEAELQILGFHAGPEDELILDDIEDDALYYEVAREAEAILNGETETEEYLIDDGTIEESEIRAERSEAQRRREKENGVF